MTKGSALNGRKHSLNSLLNKIFIYCLPFTLLHIVPTRSGAIQSVPGALSPRVKQKRCEGDDLKLVMTSRKRESIHHLPHMSEWHNA
jgi:hypothetical protein